MEDRAIGRRWPGPPRTAAGRPHRCLGSPHRGAAGPGAAFVLVGDLYLVGEASVPGLPGGVRPPGGCG